MPKLTKPARKVETVLWAVYWLGVVLAFAFGLMLASSRLGDEIGGVAGSILAVLFLALLWPIPLILAVASAVLMIF